MYEDIAFLKGEPEVTYDRYGNEKLEYRRTPVFVLTRGVYQSEFYSAAQLGLTPSIVLIISNRMDYAGQKIVEFHGEDYDVIRADWNNGQDSISLTLNQRQKDE